MASINKVILIGNLGADPELAYTASGQPVAHFNIATTDVWMDKNQEKQERTEWHRVVVWGKQGETCKKYLSKGKQVFMEGRIQTRNFNDKNGVKRYITEIVAQNVKFLGSKSKDSASNLISEIPEMPYGMEETGETGSTEDKESQKLPF